MKAIKKLWAEFKKFITRGNVIDLAVGVVIGAAFTAIVTSLTNDIIMPLINWAVNRVLDIENSLVINWGTLIQAVLDFILIAIVVFAIVKIINTIRDAGTKLGTKAGRDKELRKRAKKFVKQGMAADEARAKAEAELLAEEAPAPEEPPKPTTEELLAEIRDLLAANSKVSDGAQEEDK